MGFNHLCCVGGVFYGLKLALQRPNFRLAWDRKILSLPLLGKISRGLNTSRFARTLSICTSSAIPILEGMRVAVDVMSNRYVKQQVLVAADNVREGASLRKALDQTRLFPPMMLHMISSGEQSGELESMLTRAADNQDQNFESTVNIALGFSPSVNCTDGWSRSFHRNGDIDANVGNE